MMELKNKTALITGGSRGLGRAMAMRLAAEGARVVITGREQAALEKTVAEIREFGGTVFGIAADAGEREIIYPLVAQAAALAGPIDILINNASTLGPVPLRLLPDTDCEDFERALAVNAIGPFRLMKAVLGAMVLRQSGVIINISSDAAIEAYPTWGVYGSSKAALDHLTRIAAAELSETRVRLFSVDPGEMNTKMHADAMPEADPATLADPMTTAEKIVRIIQASETILSGSRLIASRWEENDESSARTAHR